TPVPPLQRAADVTPVFNQILMNDQEEEYDGPPQKEIPSLIVWTLGGKNVYVEGSWDNWKSRKAMQKSGKDHSLLLVLPSGVYRYRFVVDGERRCLPDLPCETDAMGNAVNLLDVNDFVPESVESVVEFEPPLSPDSSYSFQAPEDKDFAKEPPALPAQLHLGVLNSQNSEESCARPQHIVLNHLFIEKGWGAHPLVALGLTHRETRRPYNFYILAGMKCVEIHMNIFICFLTGQEDVILNSALFFLESIMAIENKCLYLAGYNDIIAAPSTVTQAQQHTLSDFFLFCHVLVQK
ncbi:hypothetical protein ACJX0J_006574, partial [Zea mays]